MKKLTFSIFLVLICFGLMSFGQSRDALEKERRELENNIKLTNELLKQTRTSASASLNELVILNNQIQKRENLIKVINNDIQLLNRRIANYNQNIEQLSKELDELKSSYARMIYYAYRNQSSYQRLMFIFSSRDFNQAYLRLKYLQQYARHRQIQAEKIVETSNELNQKVAEMEAQKAVQQRLLAEERIEIELLSKAKSQQNQTIERLKKQENDLKKQLTNHQKAIQALDNAISRIIEEERKKAEERAKAEGRPVTKEYTLTPEEKALSRNFAGNKGKLPWPVERGVITAGFGERAHPVLPRIKIQNNGIDIATVAGAKARSVFEGTVSRVIYVPGSNYAVILRHGEYLSVYSNLSEVFVKNGQKVTTKEDLGIVFTTDQEKKTELNLQIWHGTNKLNPAEWIVKQR
ncbi:MAG: peptidoglycan DD-metalloendopeptidase family protein [Bacteroidetes bacterium]|nr:peptidoglycan DD-metalloendopeptidase family protein [Bacteroidota bacterium]